MSYDYKRWESRQVVIRFGPFQGKHGQVCGVGEGMVQVVFPELTGGIFGPEYLREWFTKDDVEILTREELERNEALKGEAQ